MHALVEGLVGKRGVSSLLGIQVSTLDQEFLKLKQIILDVIVLLEELVLVSSLLHHKVLLPHVINRRLVVLLELFDLNSGVNDVLHSFLDLGRVLALCRL